jgi:hypothetical protein
MMDSVFAVEAVGVSASAFIVSACSVSGLISEGAGV